MKVGDTKPSTAYQHCIKVYDWMLQNSKEYVVDDSEELDRTLRLRTYEGALSKDFADPDKIGLSVPYYTLIMAKLKAMGCVELIRRGGGGRASLWQLNWPPTEDLYNSTEDRPTGAQQTKVDIIAQGQRDQSNTLNDLLGRIAGLEARVQMLEAFNAR